MLATSYAMSQEETNTQTRKSYLIGRFKVMLTQTKKHPDQRALDQSWVNSLVEKIGSPEILNRAQHPIGVLLLDDSSVSILQSLLTTQQDRAIVPALPADLMVTVFAGQHRLAMLAQLGLPETEQQWWHADVYMHELEAKHPAKFLSMMHESNTPQVMKHAEDVDLFRAVVKLKRLVDAKSITWTTFLQHKRSLLNFDKNLSRSISALARDSDLAEAIMDALARPHIANSFSAGSWRRLTTGRLYMVAAGLVREMAAQVDLLTEGMLEVPKDVLSVPPSRCKIPILESLTKQRKKSAHAWDILPGGLLGALERVKTRPLTLVTTLNPKKNDPWSLPGLVLIPSCLGGGTVEDELKFVQKLAQHLIKMTARIEDFNHYTSSGPEAVEGDMYHPGGIIAEVIRVIHLNSEKVNGYENRIMHTLWTNRSQLSKQLEVHQIPVAQSATKDDYQRLLGSSKPWWDLLRLYKTAKFPFGFMLSCPKDFVVEGAASSQVNQSGEINGVAAEPCPSGAKPKRLYDKSASEEPKRKRQKPSHGQQSSHQKSLDDDTDEDEDASQDKHTVAENLGGSKEERDEATHERKGADRRLNQAIKGVKLMAGSVDRGNSRALTTLLQRIVKSQKEGDLEGVLAKMLDSSKPQSSDDEQSPTGSESASDTT